MFNKKSKFELRKDLDKESKFELRKDLDKESFNVLRVLFIDIVQLIIQKDYEINYIKIYPI